MRERERKRGRERERERGERERERERESCCMHIGIKQISYNDLIHFTIQRQ